MFKSFATGRRKALLAMLILMGLTLSLFFGSLILQTYREYQNFKLREQRVERKLLQAQEKFRQKEAYIARLLDDPEFLERVARERLGYSKPDELLFRFDEEQP
jgi:cell division protein FtsB